MAKPPRPVLAPRPAPPLSREAEAFIAGDAAAAAPPAPPAPPSSPATTPAALPPPLPVSSGRAVVQRKDGRELRRKTTYLPPELAARLDVYAARTQRDQSEITAEALSAWLDARGA